MPSHVLAPSLWVMAEYSSVISPARLDARDACTAGAGCHVALWNSFCTSNVLLVYACLAPAHCISSRHIRSHAPHMAGPAGGLVIAHRMYHSTAEKGRRKMLSGKGTLQPHVYCV